MGAIIANVVLPLHLHFCVYQAKCLHTDIARVDWHGSTLEGLENI